MTLSRRVSVKTVSGQDKGRCHGLVGALRNLSMIFHYVDSSLANSMIDGYELARAISIETNLGDSIRLSFVGLSFVACLNFRRIFNGCPNNGWLLQFL